ncbi:endonuclease domain-containing protein [Fulvivirgaceae bacterium BMA10]|uniref:Endonuclease domain-containing protein n=1 Tax=Splendidivirga corallicola TaxID=3051826 RepID=A0ABT8KL76_9BACT|nr:endonuclease domain-containing protein [Fulvivirgaceae bacterium BMA10]
MKPAKNNYYGYNKKLRPFANHLRKNMTKAEACLWKYALKARQMRGHQFRRQRPVLNYIADFMCKELKLIIEVDGITHHWEEVKKNDKIRQEKLEKAGFILLRFDDEEVLNHINTVICEIEDTILRIEKSTPCPRQRGI